MKHVYKYIITFNAYVIQKKLSVKNQPHWKCMRFFFKLVEPYLIVAKMTDFVNSSLHRMNIDGPKIEHKQNSCRLAKMKWNENGIAKYYHYQNIRHK